MVPFFYCLLSFPFCIGGSLKKWMGVRGFWNGTKMLSRHNKLIHCPKWFTEGIPNLQLDGELWMGRRTINRLLGILNSLPDDDQWKEVKYVISMCIVPKRYWKLGWII